MLNKDGLLFTEKRGSKEARNVQRGQKYFFKKFNIQGAQNTLKKVKNCRGKVNTQKE